MHVKLACIVALAACLGAVAVGAELTSSPVPTRTPTPVATSTPTPRPTPTPTRTPSDPCHKLWHGHTINCCVKHAAPPPCNPVTCVQRGGVCETNPCGHYVCWIDATPTPTVKPTPTPTPVLDPGTCPRSDCPNAPGMPNWECADGRRGGPSCKRFEDGMCGWVIVDCAR